MPDNSFKELKNLNNSDEGDKDSLITDTGVSFRDRVSNIDTSGKRIWIYPKKPKGKFHNYRIVVTIILLSLLFGLPFIKINGNPFFLINIFERQFIIFGTVFWPQDFHILALSFLALALFVVLFTAIFGRLWCGWACPQTIFMEMVFRKVEYWIEGDAKKQMKLDKQEWNGEKILKRGFKHAIFISISLVIANTLLAYLVGVDKLGELITSPITANIGLFAGVVGFTGIFYFIFSWFREQACTYLCPYGRLQSVLLDKNSIVVAYDYVRGESRGMPRKNDPPDKYGDCIDCGECIRVCPTGIDIRNGTQLECVNCTACMDACDTVMDKMSRPKGLIRYASINNIEKNEKFKITTRIALYSTALLVLVGVVTFLLTTRSEIEATILRAKGTMYQKTNDGQIANVYTATIINKTFRDLPVELKLIDIKGTIELVGRTTIEVKSEEYLETAFILKLPESELGDFENKIKIGVYSDGELLHVVKTSFSAPIKIN